LFWVFVFLFAFNQSRGTENSLKGNFGDRLLAAGQTLSGARNQNSEEKHIGSSSDGGASAEKAAFVFGHSHAGAAAGSRFHRFCGRRPKH